MTTCKVMVRTLRKQNSACNSSGPFNKQEQDNIYYIPHTKNLALRLVKSESRDER